MLNYAKLELRKNRLLFIGMALIFFISLPLTMLISSLSLYPAVSGLEAALFFWTFLGLPLTAVLFGASGGAALRAETTHNAEAPLPLSPCQKIAGAALGAGIYLAALAILVLLASFIFSPELREMFVDIFSEYPNGEAPFWRPMLTLTAFTLVHTLLVSFACSYALGQAVLGGILGAGLAGLACSGLTTGLALQRFFSFRAPFTGLAWLTIASAAMGCVVGLRQTAFWVEHRRKGHWLKGSAIVLSLSLGSLISTGAFYLTYHRLVRSVGMLCERRHLDGWDGLFPARLDKDRPAQGMLLESLYGDLLWMTPDGRRRALIAGEPKPWKHFLDALFWGHIVSAAWDEAQNLWVVSESQRHTTNHSYKLWHGKIGERFVLHSIISTADYIDRFVRRGGELGLSAWDSAVPWTKGIRRHVYAPIPSAGQQPRWQAIGSYKDKREFFIKASFEEGLSARLSPDRRLLMRKIPKGGGVRRWKLPGKAQASGFNRGFFPPIRIGGRELFLVPVEFHDKSRVLAICHPDGSTRLGWPGINGFSYDWLNFEMNGALWAFENESILYATTLEGVFLPPINISPLLKNQPQKDIPKRLRLRILHLSNFKFWALVNGDTLIEADLRTGRPLRQWKLPDVSRMITPNWHEEFIGVVEGGFFLNTGRDFYFITWDGERRYLGKA